MSSKYKKYKKNKNPQLLCQDKRVWPVHATYSLPPPPIVHRAKQTQFKLRTHPLVCKNSLMKVFFLVLTSTWCSYDIGGRPAD